jgi:hypothetical protein
LQAIIAAEAAKVDRFWILHHRDNTASARGIAKAGFALAAEIWFLDGGGLGLVDVGMPERARAGAALLGLPGLGLGSV